MAEVRARINVEVRSVFIASGRHAEGPLHARLPLEMVPASSHFPGGLPAAEADFAGLNWQQRIRQPATITSHRSARRPARDPSSLRSSDPARPFGSRVESRTGSRPAASQSRDHGRTLPRRGGRGRGGGQRPRGLRSPAPRAGSRHRRRTAAPPSSSRHRPAIAGAVDSAGSCACRAQRAPADPPPPERARLQASSNWRPVRRRRRFGRPPLAAGMTGDALRRGAWQGREPARERPGAPRESAACPLLRPFAARNPRATMTIECALAGSRRVAHEGRFAYTRYLAGASILGPRAAAVARWRALCHHLH